MIMNEVLLKSEMPDVDLYHRGKVRDVYDLGEELLIVATDRISAYDCVIPTGIPDKGKILTQISLFWFDYLSDVVENHLIEVDVSKYPLSLQKYKDQLEDRSMIVKKTHPIEVECIVRGYLSGSGWKEYQQTGEVCGIKLKEGLQESEKLPEIIFTPSTKAQEGHDENISFEQVLDIIDKDKADYLREKSIEIYRKAADYALAKDIIICDTKFEFGVYDGEIILIDEVLTPDSSRFWDKNDYVVGGSNNSFDKQFVRDYLSGLDWDKTPPAPELPENIVEKTREKYMDAQRRLVG